MQHTANYTSPLGEILLAADEAGLFGAWFAGQKYFARGLDASAPAGDLPALEAAARWLEVYFSGREPDFTPPLHLVGTRFQKEVWALLLTVPYGETTTYGSIAGQLAQKQGVRVSARAVGGAVGRNPVSLIIPCHRGVGADGSLTGYAGGIERKRRLLVLEGAG